MLYLLKLKFTLLCFSVFPTARFLGEKPINAAVGPISAKPCGQDFVRKYRIAVSSGTFSLRNTMGTCGIGSAECQWPINTGLICASKAVRGLQKAVLSCFR